VLAYSVTGCSSPKCNAGFDYTHAGGPRGSAKPRAAIADWI